jgi:L-aspartate oxidase
VASVTHDVADVLVVGAGLAGMAAALEAAGAGARVVLAHAGSGSSERAQGGLAAAIGEGDGPGLHAADTLAAGAGLCAPEVVAALTGDGPGAIDWLVDQGVAFDLDEVGRPGLALEGAHTRPRVVHAEGDRSGAAIVAALRDRLRQVRVVDGVDLVGLLRDGVGVAGARLGMRDGAELEVRAAATVLATGGYAGLYRRTVAPEVCDGAPLALALLAGAELADLEFVQFHPTAYAGPGQPFLLTEALRGAGAWVVDAAGRRFVFDADARGELAPRSVVTRAIIDVLSGAGSLPVFLDARHLGEAVLRSHFGGFLANCRGVGLDPACDLVPIAPAAHYTMGGIVTDVLGRTAAPGLFAAGECARTGVHGANRLASNSLLEAVVFGRRVGQTAARGGRRAPGGEVWCVEPTGGGELRVDELRAIIEEAAGPARDARSLGGGRTRLELARGATGHDEAARLLTWLVLEAARRREETRGAHVRVDRAETEGVWGRVELVADSDLRLSVRPRSTELANGAQLAYR